MPRSRKSGFTLVELLVVIAIIGILVGLLLPAVQAAREAARRMSCSNNMKQIALGLHNYHSSYDTLPMGVRGGSPGEGWGFSFFYSILPFIEQGPLYERILDVHGVSAGMHPAWLGHGSGAGLYNRGVINGTNISTYICPSNPMDPTNNVGGGAITTLPSYVGIQGGVDEDVIDAATGASPPAPGAAGDTDGYQNRRQRARSSCCNSFERQGIQSASGVLVGNEFIGFKHIVDGTANVIMVGEHATWLRDPSDNPVDCRTTHGWQMGTSHAGRITSWHDANGFDARQFNLVSVRYPVGTKQRNLNGVGNNIGPNNPLISAHTGGCHVGLADGSIRFITNNIDLPLLKNLSTRDSGRTKALP